MHNLDINLFSEPVSRWLIHCNHFFKESRFCTQLIGKFRRLYLVNFRKGYVRKQLKRRKGECHQCGLCCTFLFTCPFLNRLGLCLIYGRCRPNVCKAFPIDQRDINEIRLCGGECGYSFDEEPLEDKKEIKKEA